MREPDRTGQLPLDLAHAPGLSRDDLIVSAANAEAVALIDRWPDWPSNVVVFAGPAGSGKSHMIEIWRAMSHAHGLSRTDIGPAAIEDARNGPVFLDDADAGGLDENGLFHAINASRQAGQHILLAAHRFPSAWGVKLPDLASRLKAAATIEIREPDDLLLAGVITKLFADRQVDVEPHVIQYIVRRIERSLSTAMRLVERLDREALVQKTRITRALAADIISAYDEGQREFDI